MKTLNRILNTNISRLKNYQSTMTELKNNFLQVNNLMKQFKNVVAVSDVSFSIEKGDIFAFLGPNGAGKTTTIRILLDIIKADSGSILWSLNGKESKLPPASLIGYLPEERGLYTDLPMIRSLVYLASIRGMDTKQAKIAAMEWLEKLELADRAKEKLQALSKGNQQKVQFIASILHKPAFAILDEPFSGLDPLNQEKFIGYIKELNEQGTTILLSSHHMPLVEKIARKVFLINSGKELFFGTLSEIFRKLGGQQILELGFEAEAPAAKLQNLPEVESLSLENSNQARITFRSDVDVNRALSVLSGIESIVSIKSHNSDLHDIFLNLVKTHQP
jgi:ABC-2 type transport system ATP-binding protein